jgi:hypothetical protein
VNSDGLDVTPASLDRRRASHGEPVPRRGRVEGVLARAGVLLAGGGLLAGLLAFGVGETIFELIPAESVRQNFMGATRVSPTVATENVAATKNGALAFGVIGLCLGGCLGLAGGLARRSAPASVAAGAIGSVLGFALGVSASLALLPFLINARMRYPEHELGISLIMHGLIWGVLGALAGLVFTVGLGERRLWGRALTAGFCGALLGAVAFDLIGVLAFPWAKTDEPVSQTWLTRLMARLMVTVGTAAFVLLVLPDRRPTQSAWPLTPDTDHAGAQGAGIYSSNTCSSSDCPSSTANG